MRCSACTRASQLCRNDLAISEGRLSELQAALLLKATVTAAQDSPVVIVGETTTQTKAAFEQVVCGVVVEAGIGSHAG